MNRHKLVHTKNHDAAVYSFVFFFKKPLEYTQEDTLKKGFLDKHFNNVYQHVGPWIDCYEEQKKEMLITIQSIYMNWLDTFKMYYKKAIEKHNNGTVQKYVCRFGRINMLKILYNTGDYIFQPKYNKDKYISYRSTVKRCMMYLAQGVDIYEKIQKAEFENEIKRKQELNDMANGNFKPFKILSGPYIPPKQNLMDVNMENGNFKVFKILSGPYIPPEQILMDVKWEVGVMDSKTVPHTLFQSVECLEFLYKHYKEHVIEVYKTLKVPYINLPKLTYNTKNLELHKLCNEYCRRILLKNCKIAEWEEYRVHFDKKRKYSDIS